ncbi:MAG TPA: hypothetical protein VF937_01925, partial [Chloroflexota bacterium]
MLSALADLDQSPTAAWRIRYLLRVAARAADPHPIAEVLKAEADRQLFIVPRRSMPIAAAIERLGSLSHRPALEALGAMTAADALREQGRNPQALREYDRAGGLYLRAHDDVGWARTRLGSAYARATTVELGPALEEAHRARAILERHGLWLRLARLESAIGNLLRELGRTDEAMQAHTRAARFAERVVDHDERELVGAEVRINQARVYQRLDRYDLAEKLLRSAARIFRQRGRPGPVAVAESNLARGLVARGHLSQALALASQVRVLMRSLGCVSHAAVAGQVAVECLLELNRPAEAASLADEITRQLTSSGASVELARTLLQRAVARERLDRHAEAAGDLATARELFVEAGCAGWAEVARLYQAQALERAGCLREALVEAADAARRLRKRQQVVAAARADLVRASALRGLGQPVEARVAARAARRAALGAGVPLLDFQASRLLGEIA